MVAFPPLLLIHVSCSRVERVTSASFFPDLESDFPSVWNAMLGLIMVHMTLSYIESSTLMSIAVSCFLSLAFMIRRKIEKSPPCSNTDVVPHISGKVAEKEANAEIRARSGDVSQLGKKGGSKKAQKKSKKKNKHPYSSSKHNKENIVEMHPGRNNTESKVEPEHQRVRKRYALMPQIPASQIKAVKLYTPLRMYMQLHTDLDIYSWMQFYMLHPEELHKNGFPLYSLSEPGKVVIGSHYKTKVHVEDPTERWCYRCGLRYTVSEDGVYRAETECSYHAGKRVGGGPYSCCGSYTFNGCLQNKYHVSNNTVLRNVDYRKTKQKRHMAEQNSIYALDCEMCYTIQGLEVTRVSMVGVDGLTIYDSYVLPESPITDYNTDYSGITASHLRDVKTTLTDVQAVLLKHLDAQTILVGHSLDSDLKALHIVHEAVVDTSVVFPHPLGFPHKPSLKLLASNILKEKIQEGNHGHDSVEDARACMELMLWRIDSDRRMCNPSTNLISQPRHTPKLWGQVAPFTVQPMIGYFVPPVGSSCDLY